MPSFRLQAIAEMMGIPLEDRLKIFDWTNAMIGGEDPDVVASREDLLASSMELFAYSNALAEGAARQGPQTT